ncbi:MAG: hypothetical protein ACI9UU_002814, partial [Candidatus Azotimanducaceae bacterium]
MSLLLKIGLLGLALNLVTVHAQQVRLRTPVGDIEIELLPEAAPVTVANFLNY